MEARPSLSDRWAQFIPVKRRVSAGGGTAEFLAVVFAVYLHEAAHFEQAGTHTFADAVAQGFFSGSAAGAVYLFGCSARAIHKIAGDDGGPVFVIASVQDQADSVPYPL